MRHNTLVALLSLTLVGPAFAAKPGEAPRGLLFKKNAASAPGMQKGVIGGIRSLVKTGLQKARLVISPPRPMRHTDIQEALQVIPKGDRQAWASTIMVGSGVRAEQIAETEKTIPRWPDLKFPEQRLVMATIMTAMKVPYEKVEAAEKLIPEGHWETQRGVLATIMAARGISYEQIKATMKKQVPGEWKDGDQRIVIAAIKTFSHITDDQVRNAESTIPYGLYPKERGIMGALFASFGTLQRGLSAEDRGHLMQGGLLRKMAGRIAAGGTRKPGLLYAGEPYVTNYKDLARKVKAAPQGDHRMVVAEVMDRSGIAASHIQEKIDSIPAGKWPGTRNIVATLMAAGRITHEKVSEVEATIPKGLWPKHRGTVAAIIAVSPPFTWKDVAEEEARIPKGEWADGEQRIVLAALKVGFGSVTYENIRAAEKLIPKGVLPGERGILAGHFAFFANARKSWGLDPVDQAVVDGTN
jgi:hypothetical protein